MEECTQLPGDVVAWRTGQPQNEEENKNKNKYVIFIKSVLGLELAICDPRRTTLSGASTLTSSKVLE